MIAPWLAWALTLAGFLGLSLGAYFLGRHQGYVAGRSNHIGSLPAEPWKSPPTEAEFLAELIEAERKNEPPRKYRREP